MPAREFTSWRLLRKLGFAPSDDPATRRGARLLAFEAAEVVD